MTNAIASPEYEFLRQVMAAADLLFPQFKGNSGVPAKFIARSDRDYRYIRISLDDENALHLHSLQLFGDDGPLDISDSEVTVSSVYPNTEKLLLTKPFLRSTAAAYGFHTMRERNPWVVVDLKEPKRARVLVVNNRSDNYGERARNMLIAVSKDGRRWHTVYDYRSADHASPVSALFPHALAKAAQERLAYPEQLLAVADLTFRGDYGGAVTALNAIPSSKATRDSIVFAMNEMILSRRQLEWTNHGVKRTFRYWPESEAAEYVQFADRAVDQLSSSGFRACIGYGGALSFVRDHALIKHDDDLDIIVLVKRMSSSQKIGDAKANVADVLQGLGYSIAGDYLTHFHAVAGARSVDCFVGFEEDGTASWFPGPRGVFQPEDIFPPLECSFLGGRIAIPRNPFKYVSAVYGPDWMIPTPRWNHTWDRREYADWF